MTKISLIAIALFVAGVSHSAALDLKQLAPCKAAAARLCDRSEGMTMAALWKCGATLATRRHQVEKRCLTVLRRYGQLSH